MIVVMRKDATLKQIGSVIKTIEELGFRPHMSEGEEKTIIGVIGDERKVSKDALAVLPGVESVVPILKPFKLASREFKPDKTVVKLNGAEIGGERISVIAGPCAIETYDQVLEAAKSAKRAGAQILRGGAFKPRTSPYSFQGLGEEGLKILKSVGEKVGLPVITEVMTPELADLIADYVDILQVGARNMQNFALLEKVGKISKPILLKRGMMSTIEELLMSAEYIMANGNRNVILCERGIRTFEKYTRNTLDMSAVPVIQKLSHLPVIVDPSHATGERYMIAPLSFGAIASGADGLMIEIHPDPDKALCDGYQSLPLPQFEEMMAQLAAVAASVNRKI
ncbi:MAG: 3-deoxy-7-phosphoheptulonate synthase [candidate division Zixibacteria bacterium]|nr:3-deoxy-7-phosphoheptulonate synthase [candidate division Zixibacteria bacterium]MBU1470253.1 3-deoxy-7-phosphoheptulonate synthase [candidate division Zixibacteria bacterium]MBU2626429.1 3-deoxy-7-phosphoheptulonate synthase [candidate division Zixibacteria bacterium]